jgi:hypothetical protein
VAEHVKSDLQNSTPVNFHQRKIMSGPTLLPEATGRRRNFSAALANVVSKRTVNQK